MKKKILILMTILLLAFPAVNAFSALNAEVPTLHGSSGLIALPTANVQKATSIAFGGWFLFQEFGFLPRVLVSFINNWELGGGFDIQNPNDLSFTINTKYKFYDNGTFKFAIGGNFQHNANEFDSWDNGQIFLVMTWTGWANTTAFIGYTLGSDNSSNIDFGIGIEKILYAGGFGGIAIVADFTNFPYRYHKGSIQGAGEDIRGIFNFGARILIKNIIIVDFILVDILDDERSVAASIFCKLTF